MGNTFASAELPTGPVECSYTPPLKVNPSNPKVFFDMMIGSAQIGRIIMELKADVAPSASNLAAILAYGLNYAHHAIDATPTTG